MASHGIQVTGGDGGGRIQVDILCSVETETAGSRCDSRAYRRIIPCVDHQAAECAGDGLGHFDIMSSRER